MLDLLQAQENNTRDTADRLHYEDVVSDMLETSQEGQQVERPRQSYDGGGAASAASLVTMSDIIVTRETSLTEYLAGY